MESSLTSPTIPNLPKGQAVPPAPPTPHIPAPNSAASNAPAHPPASAESGTAAQRAPTASAAKQAQAAAAAQPTVSYQVADITFAAGSTALSEKQKATIAEVVKLHNQNGGTIRIVGHGEASGRNAAVDGLTLALNRAQAIAMALTGHGVPAKDISVDAAPVSGRGGRDVPRAEIYLEN